MTKIVDRWASRAVAEARRAKHAQRTPLPPKGGKGVGNPAAEALLDEVEKWREQRNRNKG